MECGLIEIDTNDGASVEGVVVPPVALPPGVSRHQHGMANKGSSPFLVNKNNVLALWEEIKGVAMVVG